MYYTLSHIHGINYLNMCFIHIQHAEQNSPLLDRPRENRKPTIYMGRQQQEDTQITSTPHTHSSQVHLTHYSCPCTQIILSKHINRLTSCHLLAP